MLVFCCCMVISDGSNTLNSNEQQRPVVPVELLPVVRICTVLEMLCKPQNPAADWSGAVRARVPMVRNRNRASTLVTCGN